MRPDKRDEESEIGFAPPSPNGAKQYEVSYSEEEWRQRILHKTDDRRTTELRNLSVVALFSVSENMLQEETKQDYCSATVRIFS